MSESDESDDSDVAERRLQNLSNRSKRAHTLIDRHRSKLFGADENSRELSEQRRVEEAVAADRLKEERIAFQKEINLAYHDSQPPFKQYLICCNYANSLVESFLFQSYMFLTILVAAILVGVETYPNQNSRQLAIINNCIQYSFVAEVCLKLMCEGREPLLYFVGPDWMWNCFDCAVTFVMLANIGGSGLKVLRILRLFRLARVFRHSAQVKLIFGGLLDGLDSILWIGGLMLMLFYCYAVLGIILFRVNDPRHFSTVVGSMLTLLQVSTLDNWGDLMYINAFGCDVYGANFYSSSSAAAAIPLSGLTYCSNPTPQYAASVLYFISFISIATFCILSLFIAAISVGMEKSLREFKRADREYGRLREKLKIDERIEKYLNGDLDRSQQRSLRLIKTAFRGQDFGEASRSYEWSKRNVYVSGVSSKDLKLRDTIGNLWPRIKESYKSVSMRCHLAVESNVYRVVLMLVCVVAGLVAAIDLDAAIALKYAKIITWIDTTVRALFVLDCTVSIIAEEFMPWRYFADNWNKFDFFVTVVCFVDTPNVNSSFVVIFRLLRIFRILKFFNVFPEAQVIVMSVVKSLESVWVVLVLLSVSLYILAIAGIVFFQQNDPWHFGTLQMAMLMLFDAITLDGWSTLLWIGVLGCDKFPGPYKNECANPKASYYLSAAYWIVVVNLCAFTLITVFIGIIMVYMEEAKEMLDEEFVMDLKSELIAEDYGVDKKVLAEYKEVFSMIDFAHTLTVGREEIQFGLKVAGADISDKDFDEIFNLIDVDGSNSIDFCEFLDFMLKLKVRRESINEYWAAPLGSEADRNPDGETGARPASFFFRKKSLWNVRKRRMNDKSFRYNYHLGSESNQVSLVGVVEKVGVSNKSNSTESKGGENVERKATDLRPDLYKLHRNLLVSGDRRRSPLRQSNLSVGDVSVSSQTTQQSTQSSPPMNCNPV